MRPLNTNEIRPGTDMAVHKNAYHASDFHENLAELKNRYHSGCWFACNSPVPDLSLQFGNDGRLRGKFSCDADRQGFDGVVHGGVVASIIDAVMVQCLMGHGIVAYTTNLSIRYRKPVTVCRTAEIETSIESERIKRLYYMKCTIIQDLECVATATGCFYRTITPA